MCQQRTPLGRHDVPFNGIEAFPEASATSATVSALVISSEP
jgi:hypothetical protein